MLVRIMDHDNTSPTSNRPRFKFNLICASKCKKFALGYATANRAQKFTRVSEEFLIAVETAVRNAIQTRINQHPSKGKTLM